MAGMNDINIGQVDDEFFRYKMPALIAKVEGRGNGIKTRVVNCAEIAKALKRPPGYVCKFFGCELGTLTKIDDVRAEYIINGSHSLQALNDVLQKFIKMFVLCSHCTLPETELKVSTRKKTIKACCAACGHVEMCDMTHKLCNYIFNNPPPKTTKTRDPQADVSEEADKKPKKEKKEKKAKKSKTAENDDEDKVSKRKSKKKSEDDDDEDAEERSPKPLKNNGAVAVGNELKKLSITGTSEDNDTNRDVDGGDSDEEEEEEEEEEDVVFTLISEGKRPKEIAAQVKALVPTPEEQDAFHEQTPQVMKGLKTALKSVPPSPATGSAICRSFDVVAAGQPKMIPALQTVLKLLYDEDLVEEDQITEWHQQSTSKAKDAVADLVRWLQTAEEESEEE